jgi:hypothetical protein
MVPAPEAKHVWSSMHCEASWMLLEACSCPCNGQWGADAHTCLPATRRCYETVTVDACCQLPSHCLVHDRRGVVFPGLMIRTQSAMARVDACQVAGGLSRRAARKMTEGEESEHLASFQGCFNGRPLGHEEGPQMKDRTAFKSRNVHQSVAITAVVRTQVYRHRSTSR